MQIKRKTSTKLKLLLLTLVFIIPVNAIFLALNEKTDLNSQSLTEDNQTEELKSPQSSALQIHDFKINNTKLFENNTFYLYQTESLYFTFQNVTSVSKVYLNISALTLNLKLDYKGSNLWDKLQNFNNPVGKYHAILNYANFSKPTERTYFDFFLDIGNPAPRIIKVWGSDTSYNPTPSEIVEGGIYATFRKTTFNLLVETINKGSVTNAVKLDYSDGLASYSKPLTAGTPSDPYRNFTYSLNFNVNTTSGKENQWKPSEDFYTFVLNASDSAGYYLFEFFIEIKNTPPLISKFSLSPNYVENPTGATTTVTINVNASDFEDDRLYYGDSERNAKYTDPVKKIENKTGVTLNPNAENLNYLKEIDWNSDAEYYTLTFTQGTNRECWIWMDVNDEIVLNKIDSFQTKFVLRHVSYPSDKAECWIKDFNTNTWKLLANLTGIGAGFVTIVNQSSQLTGNPEDYYSPTNKSMVIKFVFDDASLDQVVYLDYIDVTTTVTRRETFSRVTIAVFKPEEAIPTDIEIINYWNDGTNQWSYDYPIENIASNYGSWTFQVLFMDHGTKDYISQTWGNFSLTYSSSSKYSYTFSEQLYTFGQTFDTKIFSLGISKALALNISSIPYTNSSRGTAPLYDESFNMTIKVDGFDTSNLYYKDIQTRSLVSGMAIQKNTTSSTSRSGDEIFPTYNVTGSFASVNSNEGTYLGFKLVKNLPQNYAYHTAAWSLQLENKWWINWTHISELIVTIDNWLNESNDVDHVNFEFWNYSSNSWVLLSGCQDGTALKKFSETGAVFSKSVTSASELSSIISTSSQVTMRLNIVTGHSELKQDYELRIDYINVTIKYRNYYTAKLTLRSANNGKVTINLEPYAKPGNIMQYSTIINIKNLQLKADTFIMMFDFQNGNSSIFYYAYRKIPRVLQDEYVSQYYYEPANQINLIDKNYTLSITHTALSFTKALTINKNLFFKGDSLSINGTMDLKTLPIGHLDTNEIQIKKSTIGTSIYWETSTSINYDSITYKWSYSEAITFPRYTYDVYFCRLYIRTMTSQDYATEWREFRIINSAPVDLNFSFSTGTPIEKNRGDTVGFTFSFIDYDMDVDDAQGAVTIRFEIQNKSNSNLPEWIYATISPTVNQGSDFRIQLTGSLKIPKTTRTDAYNYSYYKWEFLVNDLNGNVQSQLSYLFYNGTKFMVKNSAPSITALTLDPTGQVYRNNSIKIRFNITDSDESKPHLLTVVNFNITAIDPTPDVYVTNSSVPYVSGKREYVYFVARNAALGLYNISIKINDSDGRAAYAPITSFTVRNNLPFAFTDSSPYSINSIYRDTNTSVRVSVNVTDVEDSWLGDNKTEDVYVILSHKSPYNTRIEAVSPDIEPLRLNLTLKYVANFTNGHRELWVGNITFNNTMDGQRFYAGALTVIAYVTDSDSALGATQLSDYIILNNAPQLTSKKLSSLEMEESQPFYFNTEVEKGKSITFYIFVTDVEGISFIKIWFFPLVGSNEVKESIESREYHADDWETELIEGVLVYKCTFDTDDLEEPDKTVKIEVNKIAVYDNDYEYKPDEAYGATFDIEDNIGITIEITGVELVEEQPIVVMIFIVVGIVAVAALIVVGIVIYRKKSSWRKFMD